MSEAAGGAVSDVEVSDPVADPTTGPAELVRVLRSGFHECSHYGAAVIVDGDGAVVHAVGDVGAPIFPRSSNKPFQAVAMLAVGAPLADADLALASASHAGEPQHVRRALAILAKAGLSESALQCPEDLPLDEAARSAVLRAGGGPRRIFMNCSGKHSGMLAATVAAGWDPTTYLEPTHPYQRAVAETIARLAGEPIAATGVDGCGAPVLAISLTGLARAFGKVAAGADGSQERAVARAMRDFPALVAGTGRQDTVLMQAHPELLVKGGAEGVHCAALPDGRAVALKVSDGAERGRMPVLMAALRSWGLGSATIDHLASGVVLGGGRPVGEVIAVPGLFGPPV